MKVVAGSSCLNRPLRTLAQAEAEIAAAREADQVKRDMEIARRRMSFLRFPDGSPVEPVLPIQYAKKLQAAGCGLALPKAQNDGDGK